MFHKTGLQNVERNELSKAHRFSGCMFSERLYYARFVNLQKRFTRCRISQIVGQHCKGSEHSGQNKKTAHAAKRFLEAPSPQHQGAGSTLVLQEILLFWDGSQFSLQEPQSHWGESGPAGLSPRLLSLGSGQSSWAHFLCGKWNLDRSGGRKKDMDMGSVCVEVGNILFPQNVLVKLRDGWPDAIFRRPSF